MPRLQSRLCVVFAPFVSPRFPQRTRDNRQTSRSATPHDTTSHACIILLASVFAPTLASPYKHSNITFPMQLLTHKVPTSKVVTKVQLELWGHKSYWRLTALEGLLDKRKIMLRMLKMSDIAIFCSKPLLGFPSLFLSPLRLKLASESLVWHHLTMSASQYIVCI